MRRCGTLRALLLILGLATPAFSDEAAETLAARFLAHMEALAPVGGKFNLETRFDQEIDQELRKAQQEWARQQGYQAKFSPQEPHFHAEWAWDGRRESLKTLEDSNIFEQFYKTPEANLNGMAPNNYNLDAPSVLAEWRPASFYLFGGCTPWSEFLAGCEYRIADPPTGSPEGAALLVASSKSLEARLLLAPDSGRLLGHEIDLGGEPYARLRIDEFQSAPDGRAFPSRAELIIHFKGKPYQFISLRAEEILFDREGVARALEVELPAGTEVHDRILKRLIPIDRPTPASDILAGKGALASAPPPTPTQSLFPAPATTMVALNAPSPWRRRFTIGGIVLLALSGLLLVATAGRAWEKRRAARGGAA